tara:strand:+ start:243 stop:563 length:321 start_codon:yes stop_codon:yes gene_type:complete
MTSTFDAIKSLCPGAEFFMTDDAVTWLETEQTQPTDAEVTAEITRLNGQRLWDDLRTKRNQLIAETDYLALSDATLSADMRTYRQALRDLPANTSDPANPTWPTKP